MTKRLAAGTVKREFFELTSMRLPATSLLIIIFTTVHCVVAFFSGSQRREFDNAAVKRG